MATITDIVPLSTNFPKIRSQYSVVDERQLQQYQQPRFQPWSPDTSEAPLVLNSSTSETAAGSCKKHLTTKFFMSIIIGLVICGIPLAVMSTLYAQKKSSSNTNSENTSSSDNSASLPTQCTTYTINSDPTRLVSYTTFNSYGPFDTTGYFTTGWYRFTGGAGIQIATTPPSTGSCGGASYPVWCNSTYPSTSGSTISVMGCVNYMGYLCDSGYSIPMMITNCNGYYVFYLQPTTSTNMRYCTTY